MQPRKAITTIKIKIWSEIASLAPDNQKYSEKLAGLQTAKERADRIREHPEEGVELVDFRWSTGGFGSVMMLNVTLRNDADIPLKDFVIHCEHSGASGTVMDENTRQLFELLQPGKTRTFRNINMGSIHNQAQSSRCEVKGATPA